MTSLPSDLWLIDSFFYLFFGGNDASGKEAEEEAEEEGVGSSRLPRPTGDAVSFHSS